MVAQREAQTALLIDPVRGGDLHLTASDLLINVGGREAHLTKQGGEDELPLGVQPQTFDAVKGQGDVVRVASGVAQQVIFQGAVLRRVVAQVDAGIDVPVPDLLVAGHVHCLSVTKKEVGGSPMRMAALHAHTRRSTHRAHQPGMSALPPGQVTHRQATLDLLFDQDAFTLALCHTGRIEHGDDHALRRGHRLSVGKIKPVAHAITELTVVLHEFELLLVVVEQLVQFVVVRMVRELTEDQLRKEQHKPAAPFPWPFKKSGNVFHD